MKNNLKCCNTGDSSYEELIKLSHFLEIISDKNRLRIICMLGLGEKCVCEIYQYLNLSQNLTSYHLKVLEKEGIVSWEKRGVKVFYKLVSQELKNNIKLLNKITKTYE